MARFTLAVTLAVAAGALAVPTPGAAAGGPTCQQVTRTVTLSAVSLTRYRLVGWLCWRGALRQNTVLLLVHGLTYDHNYWQLAPNGHDASFVDAATRDGYAALNIDRIGVGLSDRPINSSDLTTESAAYVAHQLVRDLRAGAIGGRPFAKVVSVGHSFGSQAVASEAANYGDVDGVILSGALHQASTQAFSDVLPQFHLAQLDPKFAGAGLPAGYLTTIPGTRGTIFYAAASADLDVIAQDEDLKQTATDGEVATVTNGNLVTQNITVPVLVAVGQFDELFCDPTQPCTDTQTVLGREQGNFAPSACVEAYVLTGAGHSINLHLNGEDWISAGLAWTDRRVGTTAPPTQPCIA